MTAPPTHLQATPEFQRKVGCCLFLLLMMFIVPTVFVYIKVYQ